MPAGPPTDQAKVAPERASESTPERGGKDPASWWLSTLACVLGGLIAAAGVALVESGAGGVVAVFGLLVLPTCAASLVVALILRLVLDEALPAASRLLDSSQTRMRLLVLGPLTVAALVIIAGLTRGLFGAFLDRAAAGGALAALVAIGVLTFTAFLADALSLAFVRRGGHVTAWVASVTFVAVLALSLIGLSVMGETSGGSHWLELFGVLRREELNLKPIVRLGLIALMSGMLGSLSRGWKPGRLPGRVVAATTVVALVLGGLGLSWALRQTPREAVAIQRSAGLSSAILSFAMRVTDRDGDGASPLLGGGDCDDLRVDIGPTMVDVPGNGIDEDCTGRDARLPEPPEPEQQPKPEAQVGTLPKNASVLMLTVDTLRFDLGFTGLARPGLSPNLDSLAKRSTVYERAYSLASYTSKSLGPMLLGRYPSETQRTFEHFDRFDPSVPFLQERLKEAGVRTISAQAYWYFHMKGYGLERGWDVLDHSAAPKTINIDGDSHVSGGELAEVVVSQLGALPESEPFFLWAHWVDPHSEYVRHEGFDFGGSPRERYDSEVAFVDAAIGRVLDALAAGPLADRTVVIVTSDHGEAFGEHGMIRHGFEVWEELVRVPLIVYVPGAEPRAIEKPRSLIDVAPTILEVFDITPEGEGDFVRGTSLLRDVYLPGQQEPESRPVLVDMPQGPFNQERRAFISGDLKLITTAGRPIGLFDLSKDPGEKKDLSTEPAATEDIEEELAGFVSRLKPLRARR